MTTDTSTKRLLEVSLDRLKDAWAALRMIREAVETLGPVGAMQAEEHVPGPTFADEAEAIIAGIQKMVAPKYEVASIGIVPLQWMESRTASPFLRASFAGREWYIFTARLTSEEIEDRKVRAEVEYRELVSSVLYQIESPCEECLDKALESTEDAA